MANFFSHAQTFYCDPAAAQNATEVYVSSIDLYCKARPAPQNNISGIPEPGINVYIVPMHGNAPTIMPVNAEHTARGEYAQIMPSIDASLATNLKFASPVPIQTGAMYAIIIVADGNEEFEFWTAKTGDLDLNTSRTISSLNFNGAYFQLTSDSSSWTPLTGIELKFRVNICRFFNNGVPIVANVDHLIYNIGHYEYVDYDGLTSNGQMITGEYAYMTKGTYDATISCVRGNTHIFANLNFSTWFSGQDTAMIVIHNGVNTNIRQILDFSTNEAILDEPVAWTNAAAKAYCTVPVGRIYMRMSSENVPNKRSVILSDSTANSTYYFSNACTIRTEMSNTTLTNCYFQNIIVTDVDPRANLNIPAGTSYTMTETFKYTTSDDGTTYSISQKDIPVTMFKDNILPTDSPTLLLSRSNEVRLIAGSMDRQVSFSSMIDIDLTSRNDFVKPHIPGLSTVPVYFTRYYINNDYTNENTSYGNAISKAISSRITLNADQFAEDILVYLHAYRPGGTDFKVYVKLFNSQDADAFEDKDWTLMNITQNANVYSSMTDKSDFVEYAYALPNCPNTVSTFAGYVTVTSSDETLVSNSSPWAAGIAANDLVKVYSPLFPNTNFFVASVTAVTDQNHIEIDQTFTNNSILGSGFKMDKIGYPWQAFKNIQNGNMVRYYDLQTGHHDCFDSFAIKVVFLSNSLTNIPYLSSCRAVAVSA